MADSTKVFSGFYKGVPVTMSAGSVTGGRKTAVKQFPDRDTQSVEDLGLRPRAYSLEIVVNDKANEDYFAYRDRLLAALESKGAGELIHPLYGRIENVVAVSFSLNEDFGEFGATTISVQFEVNDNTGIPQSSRNVATEIASANDAAQAAVANDIAENFTVDLRFTGNHLSAVDKVNAIIDRANAATAFIGDAADTINEFSAEVGELSANVNSLVTSPLQLAQAITGLFENVNGLYASADATFRTFIGFFGFGEDNGTPDKLDTAGRVQRASNIATLNAATASASLGYAYLAATQIDYRTTLEIDSTAAQLDAQYLAVMEGGASQETKDAITEMRVKVLEAFDALRLDASQLVMVETPPTTVRLLAFHYYGSDDLGETIAELNGIDDVSFVEGPVEVLTQ